MKKCVLIIDVQKGFINESTKHIPKLVEKIQEEYEYVYVTKFFNKEKSFYRKLIKWNRFYKNSEDFELAFSPVDRAIIIDKSIYSCVSTSFLQKLNDQGIDEIDLCGVDTDICVTKCAVDLFEAEIIPRVLSEYCASHAGSETHFFAIGVLARFIGRDQVI